MEFILELASDTLYDGNIDIVKEKYPNLDFDKFNIKQKSFEYYDKNVNKPMKINLVTININTLEELLEIRKKTNKDLIIENNVFLENKLEIMIYDDYIE